MSHGGEMQQGWISPGEMSCFPLAESHICCTPPQENCTRVAFPPKTISHMLDFSQGGIQQSSNAIPKRRTNLVEIRICSASAMGISQMLVVSKGPPQRNPHMLDAPPTGKSRRYVAPPFKFTNLGFPPGEIRKNGISNCDDNHEGVFEETPPPRNESVCNPVTASL